MGTSSVMRAVVRRVASLGLALALIALVAVSARADADARLQLRLTTEAYAGMPIGLQVVADGFEENPAPTQPTLTIAGATVQALGVQPSVSQSIQIVNGRRYESREVRWVFEYRILIDKPGSYDIPALSLTQGAHHAASQPTRMNVGELPSTDDMRLELGVPERPLWVGERFPLSISWLVRRAPQDQQFTIPMMLDDTAFQITAPPVADPRQALAFPAGNGDVQLPYVRDEVDTGGQHYTRFTFTALVTPRKAGHLDLAPAQVVARLAVGQQDFFGRSDTRLYRALDKARSIEVKPLPLTGRPASFAGAVGESFSIGVRASRTVVSLGEPVDLDVTIKSATRLDALSLGTLDGLPADRFSVPADPPAGVLSEDGLTKTFTVPVQVVGPANEIPAIAFAYFDPAKGTYATIKSDPIALQVKGTAVVGAADVVGAQKPKSGGAAPAAASSELSLVGAELALSSPGDAFATPLAGSTLWAVLAVLYLLPLGIFGFRWWQVRTATARGEASEVRDARERVAAAMARAAKEPARETASELSAALRALARAVGRPSGDGDRVIEAIELESFAPTAASAPLSAAVRAQVEAAMKAWLAAPRGRSVAAVAALLAILLMPAIARADGDRTVQARAAYDLAMTTTAPAQRQAAFARAAAAFAAAIDEHPDGAELLTDWGNAALQAGDLGTATLAYRRALAIDPGASRARKNLDWLRGRAPTRLQPTGGAATDALFFFHRTWTKSRRLVVGAGAFAIAILLLAPWGLRRQRLRRGFALPALAVWLAMTISVLVQRDATDDAVIVETTVLRAADAASAPAAMVTPIPAGIEVAVIERRNGWSRVTVPDGTAGWLPDGAVAMVTPPTK
ncbi:MAG: BatD family protein [Deltaproteobacteria bacterium]|nr:BatD family protein [Deltaproteobacteria bacterium]